MPGIAGLISERAEEALFISMQSSMNHLNYEMDSDINNGVHLSRVHLNFINKAKQPLYSSDSKYSLVFWGEIFSVEDKVEDEIKDSALFFLNLIERHGLEIVSKINGQFSAALHDSQLKTTYLISDRFGTHPLYYTQNNSRLLFASEVKALLKDKITKRIDYQGVAELFSFGHLFGSKTMFEGIFMVAPATILKYSQNKLELIEYWSLSYSEDVYYKQRIRTQESDEIQYTLGQVLIRASKRQSANAEQILVPLSGGLDSRYVAALYHHNGARNLSTFTMGPEESEDQRYGSQVASVLDFPHVKFDIRPENTWEAASKFSYYSDAMSSISAPLQNFEPLGYFSNKKQILAASQMCDALFGSTLWRSRVRTLRNNERPRKNMDDILINLFKIYDQQQIGQLFNREAYQKIEGLYQMEASKYCSSHHHPLHNYYRLLMNEHGRRGTFGGNIVLNLFYETRMLSYDNDVFNFGWQLPIVHREHQYLYRKTFASLFPELGRIKRQGYNLEIGVSKARYELKMIENKMATIAMSTPLKHIVKFYKPWAKITYTDYASWFRNQLRNDLVSFLSKRDLKCRVLLNSDYIDQLLKEHLSGKRNNSSLLWQIINLEYFYQNFLD